VSTPPDLSAELHRGAEALEIQLPDDDARTAILQHLSELYRWNRRFNLTAIREPAEGVRRHALESLVALDIARAAAGSHPEPTLLDLGSGNGYPAMPLLHSVGTLRGLLFESAARKVDFLRAVTRKSGCHDRVQVIESRVATPDDLPADIHLLTLRAFPAPEQWISALADRCSRIAAWLAREDAERIAQLTAIAHRSELRPLPTHPDATLLVIHP
jgi:16S rRNA (guanine527-N7)-methyltransferase